MLLVIANVVPMLGLTAVHRGADGLLDPRVGSVATGLSWREMARYQPAERAS